MKLSTYYEKALDILYKHATDESSSPGTRIQAAQALAQLVQTGPPAEVEPEKPAEEKKAPVKASTKENPRPLRADSDGGVYEYWADEGGEHKGKRLGDALPKGGVTAKKVP